MENHMTWWKGDKRVSTWLAALLLTLTAQASLAGPLGDRLQERRALQAQNVARALAAAQDKAAGFGGDRGKFILMGHSAGAHLVALISSSPSLTAGLGITPWLGSVLLDSAALDVPHIMEAKHARLYDRAFGREPAYWRSVSPLHALQQAALPM